MSEGLPTATRARPGPPSTRSRACTPGGRVVVPGTDPPSWCQGFCPSPVLSLVVCLCTPGLRLWVPSFVPYGVLGLTGLRFSSSSFLRLCVYRLSLSPPYSDSDSTRSPLSFGLTPVRYRYPPERRGGLKNLESVLGEVLISHWIWKNLGPQSPTDLECSFGFRSGDSRQGVRSCPTLHTLRRTLWSRSGGGRRWWGVGKGVGEGSECEVVEVSVEVLS